MISIGVTLLIWAIKQVSPASNIVSDTEFATFKYVSIFPWDNAAMTHNDGTPFIK